MFSRGATPGKVKTWSYDEEDEDFTKGGALSIANFLWTCNFDWFCGAIDATALDIWVMDQLKDLFKNATTDPTLDHQLRGNKVVFFLHLLGLDTTGHSYRPHSKVRNSSLWCR